MQCDIISGREFDGLPVVKLTALGVRVTVFGSSGTFSRNRSRLALNTVISHPVKLRNLDGIELNILDPATLIVLSLIDFVFTEALESGGITDSLPLYV